MSSINLVLFSFRLRSWYRPFPKAFAKYVFLAFLLLLLSMTLKLWFCSLKCHNYSVNALVLENQPPGTVVLRVQAHDADTGVNGEVKYGIMQRDGASPGFTINPDTGISFRLYQIIDYITFTFMHLADAFIQSNSAFRLYIFFVSMCVPWELNTQPFALLMQCSTTEPQEHYMQLNLRCHVFLVNGPHSLNISRMHFFILGCHWDVCNKKFFIFHQIEISENKCIYIYLYILNF